MNAEYQKNTLHIKTSAKQTHNVAPCRGQALNCDSHYFIDLGFEL